jgi:hypothetical protein
MLSKKSAASCLTRDNRIIGVDFLNQDFAIDAHFESMLLGEPFKIFFDSVDPKVPS